MAQFNFDTNNAPKRESNYELLPAGWYTAQVTESEIVPLKSGLGQALKLTFEVLSDGHRNRKVWARLNIQHRGSPEAERIANEQLRELCESVGIVRMSDTVELHNKPVQIKVKVRKDDSGQYEDQNEVTGYKTVGGSPAHGQAIAAGMNQRAAAPAANAPVAGAAPAAAAPAGSTPPWVKRA
jgi:hypothetical protein